MKLKKISFFPSKSDVDSGRQQVPGGASVSVNTKAAFKTEDWDDWDDWEDWEFTGHIQMWLNQQGQSGGNGG